MNPNTDLQLVPETLLKKRHDLDALQAARAASALKRSVSRKNSRQLRGGKNAVVKIVKPETILIQSRQRKKGAIRYNRVNKKGMQKRASNKSVVKTKVWDSVREEEVDEKDLPPPKEKTEENEMNVEDDSENEAEDEMKDRLHKIPYKANSIGATTVFAVLLRPTIHTTPKSVKKTLSSLRLRRVNEGVFLPYNSTTRKMLHLVEPYVLYGVPSLETISDLVRRRGFCKVDGKRVPLADNNVIERELGELGLICVEDLVQVLSSASLDDIEAGDGDDSTFNKVAKFLWPFRLTARKSKFQKKMLDLKDGKLYGDRGEAMNGYIKEML